MTRNSYKKLAKMWIFCKLFTVKNTYFFKENKTQQRKQNTIKETANFYKLLSWLSISPRYFLINTNEKESKMTLSQGL